jgi:putative transposase
MAKTKRPVKDLPTIWNCPDELWELIAPVLAEFDPEPKTGRPRIDQRKALDGIIHQMRSGCQWNHLPKEFGDDASIHRTFQRWIERGVLEAVWARLVESCDELRGVHWDWQSADAALGKARFGGTTSAPTPRTVRKTAANARSWSRATAARWRRSSRPPTCTTR